MSAPSGTLELGGQTAANRARSSGGVLIAGTRYAGSESPRDAAEGAIVEQYVTGDDLLYHLARRLSEIGALPIWPIEERPPDIAQELHEALIRFRLWLERPYAARHELSATLAAAGALLALSYADRPAVARELSATWATAVRLRQQLRSAGSDAEAVAERLIYTWPRKLIAECVDVSCAIGRPCERTG